MARWRDSWLPPAWNKWLAPVVTSLPSTAEDGDEVYFRVPADGRNNLNLGLPTWRLKYNKNASNPSLPWEVVGGAPLSSTIYADEPTLQGANVWHDLTTIGPQIAIPLTGVYTAMWGAQASSSVATSGALMDLYYTNGTIAATGDGASCNFPFTFTLTTMMGAYPAAFGTIFTRDTTVRPKYLSGNAVGTTTFRRRWLTLMPSQVGP